MNELFVLIAIISLILIELVLDSICLINLDKVVYLVLDIMFWSLLSIIELIYFHVILRKSYRESSWKKTSSLYFLLTLFSICSFICYEVIHISDIEANTNVSDKCLYQKYKIIEIIMYLFEAFMCFHLIYISYQIVQYIKFKHNNRIIDSIERQQYKDLKLNNIQSLKMTLCTKNNEMNFINQFILIFIDIINMFWIQYPFYLVLISYFVIEATGSIECLITQDSHFKTYEIFLFSVEIFMYILSTCFILNHVWYQYQIIKLPQEKWSKLSYIKYPRLFSTLIISTITLNIISMIGEFIIYNQDKEQKQDLLLCTVFEKEDQGTFSKTYYWIVFSLDIISILYLVRINLRVLAYEKQPGTFIRSVQVTIIDDNNPVLPRRLNFIQKYFLYECQICFQGFETDDQLIRYRCRHKFHRSCIQGNHQEVPNICFICEYGTPAIVGIL